jgi:hypothetical protein
MSVCTYHRPTDAQEIESYLKSLGYKTIFTQGYMYINTSFNKAIIRARKEDPPSDKKNGCYKQNNNINKNVHNNYRLS